MNGNEWEKSIHEALKQTANQVKIDEVKREQMKYAILRECKEEKKMKKTWKKVVGIVAALSVLCVGAAFAGGKIVGYRSSSYRDNDVREYEEMPKEIRKLGYEVQIPEKFTNGYDFSEGQVISVDATDEAGNVLGSYPSLDVFYEKEGGGMISVSIHKPLAGQDEEIVEGEKLDCDGVDAYYKEQEYLFVPPSYELSKEEQALEASGELMVSYGSNEVERTRSKYISWEEDGISYLVMSMEENNMGAQDFLQMAKELRRMQ
ncbi:MAG: hypothetical protein Q4D90_08165 [bacterium]|nr:hypothetical protein [bacterium]